MLRTAMLRTGVAKLILITAVVLTSANSSFAREWRGIVPLRSTRTDVIRLTNQCADQKEACRFTLGTEDVHILFSGGLTAENRECASRLPPETVMFIALEPREKLKISDLHLDKRRLHSVDGSDPVVHDFKGYRTDDGLVVSLFKDRVLQIVYLPSETDAAPCSDYYRQPESFAQIKLAHMHVITGLKASETTKAGEKLRVSADSTMNETRGYTWTVSAGKIIAGQYTKEVTIDKTGLAGQKLIVTAEISEPFGRHTVTATCVVQILP